MISELQANVVCGWRWRGTAPVLCCTNCRIHKLYRQSGPTLPVMFCTLAGPCCGFALSAPSCCPWRLGLASALAPGADGFPLVSCPLQGSWNVCLGAVSTRLVLGDDHVVHRPCLPPGSFPIGCSITFCFFREAPRWY